MLVEYFNSRPASWLRPRLATALFLISAVATVALLCLGLKHPDIVRLRGEANLALVVEIPFDLLVIAFFASAVLGSLLLRAVLRLRFLAFIGLISYSLFLLHNTVLSLVNVPYFSTAIRDWVAGQDLFGV